MTQPSSHRRERLSGRSKFLLAAGAVALFAGGLYFGIQFAKPPPRPDFSAEGISREPEPRRDRAREIVSPDIDQAPPAPPPVEVRRQPPPGRRGRPRIAIVIDDLGRGIEDLDRLGDLGIPLTYSVLPFESRTPQVVTELRRRDAEFLCHLPMEAQGGASAGPGALLLRMSHDELVAATRRALAAVPGAVGVNNHMGSAVSAERRAITTVLTVIAEEGLYYIDSRTGIDTLGYSVARQLGIPAGERQVFLDADRDPEAIRHEFERLLALGTERGGAIAIAHPTPETLQVLASAVPAAIADGFEFVTARSLLESSTLR
ncbi:MAG: divergent polysaccharide deacetylase family protein [bacterium]|nr:divergent polysaccharide deacetylase family protein [bacterium]